MDEARADKLGLEPIKPELDAVAAITDKSGLIREVGALQRVGVPGLFRIIVRPDAQKTNSRQTNHNLLLSETAIVDSKPTLEIHNDDVKCSHGSTIGQLDEEAMFYLRARGVSAADARKMLIYAFASEIVDRMKVEPVKETIRESMFQRIPKGLPDRRSAGR